MTGKLNDLAQMNFARTSLLELLVRRLCLERAMAHDQTGKNVDAWGAEVKAFFETSMPKGEPLAYMLQACDRFFPLLASEVEAQKENKSGRQR